MFETMGIYDAKNAFTHVINRVNSGESIEITKHGKPVALIVPYNGSENVKEAISQIKGLAKKLDLGGVDIQAMINEGRA